MNAFPPDTATLHEISRRQLMREVHHLNLVPRRTLSSALYEEEEDTWMRAHAPLPSRSVGQLH